VVRFLFPPPSPPDDVPLFHRKLHPLSSLESRPDPFFSSCIMKKLIFCLWKSHLPPVLKKTFFSPSVRGHSPYPCEREYYSFSSRRRGFPSLLQMKRDKAPLLQNRFRLSFSPTLQIGGTLDFSKEKVFFSYRFSIAPLFSLDS